MESGWVATYIRENNLFTEMGWPAFAKNTMT